MRRQQRIYTARELLETQLPPLPPQLLKSVEDTAWILGGIHPNHVRNLIKEGKLNRVHVGRRVMVTTESIKRLLEEGAAPQEP